MSGEGSDGRLARSWELKLYLYQAAQPKVRGGTEGWDRDVRAGNHSREIGTSAIDHAQRSGTP